MLSNPIQAELDRMQADANHVHSTIDKLMKAYPAQSAIDKVMSLNSAMVKLEPIFSNPAITALDRLYTNQQIAARLAQRVMTQKPKPD